MRDWGIAESSLEPGHGRVPHPKDLGGLCDGGTQECRQKNRLGTSKFLHGGGGVCREFGAFHDDSRMI